MNVVEGTASKVPEVTLVFWIIKIAATTLGETGGDTVTMTLNWGYLLAPAFPVSARRFLILQIARKSFIRSCTGRRSSPPPLPAPHGRLRRPFLGHRLRRRLVAPFRVPDGDARRLVLVAGSISVATVNTPKSRSSIGSRSPSRRRWHRARRLDRGRHRAWLRRRRASLRRRLGGAGRALFLTSLSRVFLFWAAFILTRPLAPPSAIFSTSRGATAAWR